MSQTIVSVLVILLAQILPRLGVSLDSVALTTTVQSIVTVIAAGWIWYRRFKQGGVTTFGIKK
jgi:uncharacterized membrane protein